jgi:hypothetical protein
MSIGLPDSAGDRPLANRFALRCHATSRRSGRDAATPDQLVIPEIAGGGVRSCWAIALASTGSEPPVLVLHPNVIAEALPSGSATTQKHSSRIRHSSWLHLSVVLSATLFGAHSYMFNDTRVSTARNHRNDGCRLPRRLFSASRNHRSWCLPLFGDRRPCRSAD